MSATKLLGYTDKDIETMGKYTPYAPKVELNKIVKARQLLKQQQQSVRNQKPLGDPLSGGRARRAMQLESTARNQRVYGAGASRHFHARSQRDHPRFHLPMLDIEALERQAVRRNQRAPGAGPLQEEAGGGLQVTVRCGSQDGGGRGVFGAKAYSSAAGMLLRQRQEMDNQRSHFSSAGGMARPREGTHQMNLTQYWKGGTAAEKSLLETRLRQRGISMDEFYGPRSTDSHNRNPYKTDEPFFEPITGNARAGGGPMSNSTFTKMPAE